jgi:hypothetical protein
MEIWESGPTFWYSTQGKNPTRTAPDLIFLLSLQSIQNYSFQQTCRCAKSRKPEPLIGWMQVNTRWKAVDVLYLFGIWLPARFQIEQHKISIYWLLLAVKTELMSLFGVPCSEQGSQIRRILTKFDEMRRNRPGPNSKIGEFWNLNLIFLKKYVKNLIKF